MNMCSQPCSQPCSWTSCRLANRLCQHPVMMSHAASHAASHGHGRRAHEDHGHSPRLHSHDGHGHSHDDMPARMRAALARRQAAAAAEAVPSPYTTERDAGIQLREAGAVAPLPVTVLSGFPSARAKRRSCITCSTTATASASPSWSMTWPLLTSMPSWCGRAAASCSSRRRWSSSPTAASAAPYARTCSRRSRRSRRSSASTTCARRVVGHLRAAPCRRDLHLPRSCHWRRVGRRCLSRQLGHRCRRCVCLRAAQHDGNARGPRLGGGQRRRAHRVTPARVRLICYCSTSAIW